MKIIILMLLSTACFAQSKTVAEKVKYDSVKIVNLPPTMEAVTIANEKEIQALQNPDVIKQRITIMEQQNAVLFQTVMEANNIDPKDVVDKTYTPGQIKFKLKPKVKE